MTLISNFDVHTPAFAGFVGKSRLTVASESPADSWARAPRLVKAESADDFRHP